MTDQLRTTVFTMVYANEHIKTQDAHTGQATTVVVVTAIDREDTRRDSGPRPAATTGVHTRTCHAPRADEHDHFDCPM